VENSSLQCCPLRGNQETESCVCMVPGPRVTVPGLQPFSQKSHTATVGKAFQFLVDPIQCTYPSPNTENDSCPIVGEPVHVAFAKIGYRRPLLCAPDDHILSLAKSRACRTALSRTNCPLWSQHECFQGPSGFKPSRAHFRAYLALSALFSYTGFHHCITSFPEAICGTQS